MAPAVPTLDDLLGAISRSAFFAEYRDQKPLHVGGRELDLSAVMSWAELTRLLNMTGIWSASSLLMVLDRTPIPAEAYCRPAASREGGEVMQPVADLVKAQLRRGASLVANDIDSLSPGVAELAANLEATLGGKAQGNLYCSWQARQAFDTHFDTHDVFALHIEGEKVWQVFEGRLDNPIAHPAYKSLDQDYHNRHRGKVLMEVTMRPGDLLYIPRGQYHDALASSEGSIHIAFGVTYPIGFDALNLLQELALEDRLVRGNLPAAGDGDALHERLAQIGARLSALCQEPELRRRVAAFQAGFHYTRGGFDLPNDALETSYRVRGDGLEVRRQGESWVLNGTKGTVPIPPGADEMVRWVIARPQFASGEFGDRFASVPSSVRERFLRDMAAMRVISPL